MIAEPGFQATIKKLLTFNLLFCYYYYSMFRPDNVAVGDIMIGLASWTILTDTLVAKGDSLL